MTKLVALASLDSHIRSYTCPPITLMVKHVHVMASKVFEHTRLDTTEHQNTLKSVPCYRHTHHFPCESCLPLILKMQNKSTVTTTRAQQLLRWATVPEHCGPKRGGGCCALFRGGAESPCKTTSRGRRPNSISSGILIHPTVWPQYTNITDRQTGQDRTDRQRSDIG